MSPCSPPSFWTKDGYFGIWESTSDNQEWYGNCKHVIHYAQSHARTMSSWSVLLGLQGFSYDGPQQHIGFQPVWQPEDHASFFSAAKGWGLFTQTRNDGSQESTVHLKFGTLDLQTITLAIPEGEAIAGLQVTLDRKVLPHQAHQQQGTTTIQLESPATLEANATLNLR